MTSIVLVEYRLSLLSIRQEILASLGHPVISVVGSGFDASASVREGDPKTVILDCATEWGADLIVVGSHGRKGVARFVLGSVSEVVARYARCSVEIVRLPSNV